MYNTLAHRAKVVSSTPEDLNKELEHLNKALKDCQFPNWALNKLQQQFLQKHNHDNNNNNPLEEQTNNNSRDSNNGPTNKNISIVIPYIKGLGEKFKKTCNKQGIQVHFKGTNTVKQLLMAPKDKDPKLAKSGIIYRYRCPPHKLHRTIHRRIRKNPWWQIQGTPQGTLTHTPTHIHIRTPSQPRMFFHSGQGCTGIGQEHQGSHVHQG